MECIRRRCAGPGKLRMARAISFRPRLSAIRIVAELAPLVDLSSLVRSLAGTMCVGLFGAILAAKLGTGDLHGTLSMAAIGERSALAQTFQIVFFGTSAGFALSLVALWRLEERPLRAGKQAGAPDDRIVAESAND